MSDLNKSKPRFIIDMYGEFKPWVKGADTTRDFKELKFLIESQYLSVFEKEGYRIYELRNWLNNQPSYWNVHYDDINLVRITNYPSPGTSPPFWKPESRYNNIKTIMAPKNK